MEPTEENVRAWDARYRTSAPPRGIPAAVAERLPNLDGRHVLHLGCGTGEGSVELAERGALVTAVDDSEEALGRARGLADSVAWLRSDLHALPHELLRGRFHLVLAESVLERVPDIRALARTVEAALRSGGYLLLYDRHPVAACVDAMLRWRLDYFAGPGTGVVVTALARAGLTVRRVEELPAPRPLDRLPGALVVVARK